MEKSDEIPRGQLSIIVLSTLIDSDKYGYEIINDISEKTNGKFIIKQPSLYSCLRRMEEQNLISSYWRDSEIGGRRHYYSITDFGKKHAEKWQSEIVKTEISSNQQTEEEQTNNDNNTNEVKKNDVVMENNNKPIILEQDNLFKPTQETTNVVSENKKDAEESVDNTFVQYDLFSAPTFISKPSVDVFETLKSPAPANEEITSISLEEVSIKQPENPIVTNYESKVEEKFKETSSSNIKQEFMMFKNKQKSFCDSYKEEIKKPNFELNIDEPLNILSKEKSVINDLPESPLPTIFQTTTFDEEESISKIDLNKLHKEETIKEPDVSTQTHEEITTSNIPAEDESDKIDLENVANKETEELSVIKEQPITEEPKKDDAVYITEKPDINALPKVRKIAPSRFEIKNYEALPSILSIQNQQFIKHTKEIVEEYDLKNVVEDDKKEFVAPQSTYTDYNQLAVFYKANDIKFSAYEKLPKSANKSNSNFIRLNKFRLISSICMFLLMSVMSVGLYFAFISTQPTLTFMFYIPSALSFAYSLVCLILYNRNRTNIVPKASAQLYLDWQKRILISVLITLVIFSINLFCGMNFENMNMFGVSFTYLSILTLSYPLNCLLNYLVIKSNVVYY